MNFPFFLLFLGLGSCGLVYSSSVTISGVTIDTTKILNEMHTNIHGDTGQIIYVKWNNGCLDGALQVSKHAYAIYPGEKCPDYPQLKWHWVLDRQLHPGNLVNMTNPCLDLDGNHQDGHLLVRQCTGAASHQFFMQIHPNQIDFAQRKVYFSIHSAQYVDRCLTVCPHCAYYSEDFKQTINANFYRLEHCTGSDAQSFFLGVHWYDELNTYGDRISHNHF